MGLLDSLLPEFDAVEYHEITVNKPVESVFDALKCVDFGASKTIATLFKLRGIPSTHLTIQGLVDQGHFSLLGEESPHELVLGLMVNKAPVPIESGEAFATNSVAARMRIGCNYQCSRIDDTTTRLSTETRVAVTGTMSKVFFHCYWLFIKPFSGWIRRIMLRLVKEKAEGMER
ncbi:hypothetical protein [Halodesulfovibrio marinisediminis]|uniref:Polyketide cyclase / dehydrase and lipid transport n=1 Tax=Halodesulfovibrio marinisediminis DSM 17456 TaxID=1121457 RepID=A0A1N6HGZ9_9BACT|nr:hypothetical protein [Halodesulfovibrio marinisediminis]SIO19128.1 hypothetical protein SAMN02745161_2207 [Halodesulfovibrio marinisediminis DSM 17456]